MDTTTLMVRGFARKRYNEPELEIHSWIIIKGDTLKFDYRVPWIIIKGDALKFDYRVPYEEITPSICPASLFFEYCRTYSLSRLNVGSI